MSGQENTNQEILPLCYKRTYGYGSGGGISTIDRWSRKIKHNFMFFYKLENNRNLDNQASTVMFITSDQPNLLDDELRNLRLIPRESISMQWEAVISESRDCPLLVKVLASPLVAAVGLSLFCVVGVGAPLVAIVAFITLGAALSIASYFSEIALNKAPWKMDDVEVSVQLLGSAEKIKVSDQFQNRVKTFFINQAKSNSNDHTLNAERLFLQPR